MCILSDYGYLISLSDIVSLSLLSLSISIGLIFVRDETSMGKILKTRYYNSS